MSRRKSVSTQTKTAAATAVDATAGADTEEKTKTHGAFVTWLLSGAPVRGIAWLLRFIVWFVVLGLTLLMVADQVVSQMVVAYAQAVDIASAATTLNIIASWIFPMLFTTVSIAILYAFGMHRLWAWLGRVFDSLLVKRFVKDSQ